MTDIIGDKLLQAAAQLDREISPQRDLWPGIDLKLTGQPGELKYEFRVRPGARVADIQLA